MTGIFIRIIALIACFLFASAFAGGAGKAFDEKRWGDFGANVTLCICFWMGICAIIQMWCGVV